MDYTKNGILRKEEDLESFSNKKTERRVGAAVLRIFMLVFLSIAVVGICSIIGVVRGIIDDAPDVDTIDIAPSGYATYIYDAQGNQLQKLTASNSNRIAVSIDQIPLDLQHAVVAVEDERFYEHNGIDLRGIMRAAVVGISHNFKFTEGASTITQQLLKNNVFTDWTNEDTLVESIKRKVQEQYLSVQLEKKLQNKDLIMENYLNTINLGAGCYGVQAASQKYFSKSVQDLTLSEASVIAGITQNPSRFNPITHPDYNAERREKVLKDMLAQGYIDQTQYDAALADNVYDRIAAAQVAQSVTEQDTVYSYFVDELTEQVVNDLQEQKGYTEKKAYQMLYSGGLRIYTTQDTAVQQICDEEYSNPENFPSEVRYSIDWALTVKRADGTEDNYSKEMMLAFFREQNPDFQLLFSSEDEARGYIDQYKSAIPMNTGDSVIAERVSFSPEPQSSLCIMDQSNGYVKAIVGGRGEKTASLTLNRATNTYRQPGSTFKILSTYAPALNECDKTLATVYVDEPYQYAGGREVRNWLTNSYGGNTTIRQAITNSVNVVAVKCLTEITPQLGYDYLLKFGFSNLDSKNDVYQPLALGGIYNGVSCLELTAAYAAIANKGVYTKPLFYTKILDQDGNVIIDNTPETTQVLRESTAWLLTSAMESVVTEGTGEALQIDGMTVAGKTGTTSNYNDVWFAGFTPYYTCAVWAGYDNNEKLPDTESIYRNYHKVLWQKIMTRINGGLTDTGFPMPDAVEELTVCSETGLLAGSGCPRITEYFAKDTAPTEKCTEHSYRYHSYDYNDYDGSSSNDTNSENSDTSTGTTDTNTNDNTGTGGTGTDTGSGTQPGTGGTADTGGGSNADTGGGGGTTDTGGDSTTDTSGGNTTDTGGAPADTGNGDDTQTTTTVTYE